MTANSATTHPTESRASMSNQTTLASAKWAGERINHAIHRIETQKCSQHEGFVVVL